MPSLAQVVSVEGATEAYELGVAHVGQEMLAAASSDRRVTTILLSKKVLDATAAPPGSGSTNEVAALSSSMESSCAEPEILVCLHSSA